MRAKIVKITYLISVIAVILSACCLDSTSNIPMIIMGICSCYITLVTYANIAGNDEDENENERLNEVKEAQDV